MHNNHYKATLTLLENLAEQINLTISYEEFNGRGGLVKYNGAEKFIICKSLNTEEKIAVLCNGLKKMDLDSVFMPPMLRKIIYGDE